VNDAAGEWVWKSVTIRRWDIHQLSKVGRTLRLHGTCAIRLVISSSQNQETSTFRANCWNS
jgi:hypothetical protein